MRLANGWEVSSLGFSCLSSNQAQPHPAERFQATKHLSLPLPEPVPQSPGAMIYLLMLTATLGGIPLHPPLLSICFSTEFQVNSFLTISTLDLSISIPSSSQHLHPLQSSPTVDLSPTPYSVGDKPAPSSLSLYPTAELLQPKAQLIGAGHSERIGLNSLSLPWLAPGRVADRSMLTSEISTL